MSQAAFESVEGDDFLPMIVKTVEIKQWPSSGYLGDFTGGYTVHSKELKFRHSPFSDAWFRNQMTLGDAFREIRWY